MSFGFKYKNPLDLTQKGIGINIPFNAAGVFEYNYNTKKALRNNIINYFLTNPGERFDNPSFGGGLRKYLFEQLTSRNIDTLRLEIQEKFNQNFPGVVLGNVDILTDTSKPNQLDIKIYYSIPNTDIEDSINLNFN